MNGLPDTAVILPAGGSGTRMGTAIPKQFIELCGIPVIIHTIRKFMDILPSAPIYIALPESAMEEWEELSIKYPECRNTSVYKGGGTRFDSVNNVLKSIPKTEYIIIHDAVRPLVSGSLIIKSLNSAVEHGNSVPAVTPTDSYRIRNHDTTEIIDRDLLLAVQTPQVFTYDILVDSYCQASHNGFTDDAAVIESAGHTVNIIQGERTNIKITTLFDLAIAETYLNTYGG